MHSGRFVFSQVMDHLPMKAFRRCVQRYQGNRHIQSFTCLDQFLCMAFSQLTFRESLRDIEACLRAHQDKLYHMGIRGGMSRNTLANANQRRDWRIYAEFAQIMIRIARPCMPTRTWGWNSTTPSTRWTRPPSTCACRCFRGRCSAPPNPPSSCTRYWTCGATFRRLYTSPRGRCMI